MEGGEEACPSMLAGTQLMHVCRYWSRAACRQDGTLVSAAPTHPDIRAGTRPGPVSTGSSLRYINFRLGHAGSGVIQKTHFSLRSTCFFFLFTKKTLR